MVEVGGDGVSKRLFWWKRELDLGRRSKVEMEVEEEVELRRGAVGL